MSCHPEAFWFSMSYRSWLSDQGRWSYVQKCKLRSSFCLRLSCIGLFTRSRHRYMKTSFVHSEVWKEQTPEEPLLYQDPGGHPPKSHAPTFDQLPGTSEWLTDIGMSPWTTLSSEARTTIMTLFINETFNNSAWQFTFPHWCYGYLKQTVPHGEKLVLLP